MTPLLVWLACGSDPVVPPPQEQVDAPDPPDLVPPGPETCDAGTDVWVQRVFPLLLGRRPHGAAEIRMWAAFADEQGRDTAVRALARSPEYRGWWKEVLSDLLYASRSEFGKDSGCFAEPLLAEHDGSLTRFVRLTRPDAGAWGQRFGMADLMLDALYADDISAVYQVNLFARMNYVQGTMGSIEDGERVIRRAVGDQLLETYIDRNVACMTCHNSEFSVTDDPDPARDHAWGLPSPFEAALFGTSTGPADPDDFYAMARSWGLVLNVDVDPGGDAWDYDQSPWGMDGDCGRFERQPPNYDILGHGTSFFGRAWGSAGTAWEIEQTFADGLDALALGSRPDEEVEAGPAFAWLTAQHFVDQVWRRAFGKRLLLPYGLSRNPQQQERLQALTEGFVGGGWSLAELLVSITLDPYFNTGLPGTCEAEPYGLLPVIDPYSVEFEGELVNNGPGDLVHRYDGRLLLRSVYETLGYGQPPGWFFLGDPEEDFQRSIGIFLSDASAGSDGVDFQGMLAWEGAFHACQDPAGGAHGFLEDLRVAAIAGDRTVEDAVEALRDRLLARGAFDDDEERDAVEALLGVPLETPVANVDRAVFGRNLGLLCGVLTASPGFLLTVEPQPSGSIPRLATGVDEDCTRLEGLATEVGSAAGCR